MKSIAKIVCCTVALAWMYSATAKEEVMHSSMTSDDDVADSVQEDAAPTGRGGSNVLTQSSAGTDTSSGAGDAAAPTAVVEDVTVATPPAPRVPVMAHTEKVDRTTVEKRMEQRHSRTQQRTADAEKDVAARVQVNGAP